MMRALLLASVLAIGLFGCSKGHNWQEVAEDDPRLEEARAQARSSWPDFLSSFGNKQPFTEYTVEVLYNDGSGSEYVLLQVLEASESEIKGTVLGYPSTVGLLNGEMVTASVDALSDWAYITQEGEEVGAFVANKRKELERRD